mmetsp:Transcript_21901/g.28352  ORF Transcript_21901/g.28352 Transcript_21901/m.28352 type:complete len:276 (-) Transcript_21901:148-975(-)
MGFRSITGLLTVVLQNHNRLSVVAAKAANTSAFVIPSAAGAGATANSESIRTFSVSAGSSYNESMQGYPSDPDYPGTAVERMMNARERVRTLEMEKKFVGSSWDDIRRDILWAGGMKDLPNSIPGQGYTGHSFNDYNHVDLTCLLDQMSDNENDGKVKGIAIGNRLGDGIRVASLVELGPGGSWSTCAIGCNKEPPRDVAHLQFNARIAFKLVWIPNDNFDQFVLVDDDGKLLATGKPTPGGLPAARERMMNFEIVKGSKYAVEAVKLAQKEQVE